MCRDCAANPGSASGSATACLEPYRLARKYVDEVMLVSTDEICAATKDIFDDTRAMVEPAGALAVAG